MEKMNLSQRVVNFDPNDKNTLNFTRLVDLSQCQEKRRHQVFLRTLRAMFLKLLVRNQTRGHAHTPNFSLGQVTDSLTATGVAL